MCNGDVTLQWSRHVFHQTRASPVACRLAKEPKISIQRTIFSKLLPAPWSTSFYLQFFSHVLNLSKGASLSEVHERYRTLSLAFHPDKQQDPESKEIATREFLRIQKAYEGLSRSQSSLFSIQYLHQFYLTLFFGTFAKWLKYEYVF